MVSGGSVVYEGPSVDAAGYLTSLGYKQPEDTSDADFCIDVLNQIIEPEPTSEFLKEGSIDLADIWNNKNSTVNISYNESEQQISKFPEQNHHVQNRVQDFSHKRFFILSYLQGKRAFIIRMRQRDSLIIYSLLSVIMAGALSSGFSILIQTSYLNTLTPTVNQVLKDYYPSAIAYRKTFNVEDLAFKQLLFFMSSSLGAASSLAAVPLLSVPISLLKREDASGISFITFALGRIIADLINVIWIAFMFLGVFLLFGHSGSWYYWIAVIIPTAFASSGLGYFCTVISRPGYASTFSILLTFVCCVFSGVSPTLKQIENLYIANWIWYLSFATWTAEATYITWTKYLTDREWEEDEVYNGAARYGYKLDGFGRSIGWLIALGIFWRVISCVILYFKVKNYS
jgi:hypothetical protein